MKGKKTGGRAKGTANKTTTFTKIIINNILSDYQSSGLMADDISELEPKDRLHVMIKLMEFNIPKPQSVSLDITSEGKKTIEDELIALSEENEK
jgi:hypothetical protein